MQTTLSVRLPGALGEIPEKWTVTSLFLSCFGFSSCSRFPEACCGPGPFRSLGDALVRNSSGVSWSALRSCSFSRSIHHFFESKLTLVYRSSTKSVTPSRPSRIFPRISSSRLARSTTKACAFRLPLRRPWLPLVLAQRCLLGHADFVVPSRTLRSRTTSENNIWAPDQRVEEGIPSSSRRWGVLGNSMLGRLTAGEMREYSLLHLGNQECLGYNR